LRFDFEFTLFHLIGFGSFSLSFPKPIPESLQDLLHRLLCKDQSKRIALAEMKQHPWITDGGTQPMTDLDPVHNQVVVTEHEHDTAMRVVDQPLLVVCVFHWYICHCYYSLSLLLFIYGWLGKKFCKLSSFLCVRIFNRITRVSYSYNHLWLPMQVQRKSSERENPQKRRRSFASIKTLDLDPSSTDDGGSTEPGSPRTMSDGKKASDGNMTSFSAEDSWNSTNSSAPEDEDLEEF
jgi:serine/threonine protein kinase